MTLDLEKLTTTNPLLVGEGLISICEAAKAIGLSDGSLIGELLNDRAAVFTYAQHWQGWHVKDLDVLEREPDGGFVLNSVEALGTRLAHSGIVRPFNPRETLSSLLGEGKATESTFRLHGSAAFFTDAETVISSPAWMVQKAAIERIQGRLARAIPPEAQKPAIAPEKPIAEPWASPATDTPQTSKRFSDLFELYSAHQQWSEPHRKRMANEAGMFAELMNDPPLEQIGVEMIHAYAALLAQFPEDKYQSTRKYPGASLRDMIGIAKRDSLPLNDEKAVGNHVARLGQVFTYGVSPAGMMRVNPAAKFKRSWGKGRKSAALHDREQFTPEELARIFSQDWFSMGAGKFDSKGTTYWRPHYFWLPVLALTTGARLNELSQLYLDDVRQSDEDSSVWLLDFNLNQPDKGDLDDDDDSAPDKSLKTINSERVIPLHDLVVRSGLPEYVATLRKEGETRLFPELKRDEHKGYGKPAGSWFNGRFLGNQLGMVRDGKKTFHSFRHTFATAAERLDIGERVMAQLLGHQRGKTQGMTRYAKDRDAAALKPIVDRLEFAALENLGRFNPEAALKAIKWAKRLKQARARSHS